MGSAKSPSHKTSAAIMALCTVYVFLLGAQLTHAENYGASGTSSLLHPKFHGTSTTPNGTPRPTLADIKAKIASTTLQERAKIDARLGSTSKEKDVRNASSSRPVLNTLIHKEVEAEAKTAIGRLTAAADRLTNISMRIGTRIDKLVSAGASMATAKALHVTADAKVAAAKAKIALIVKPTLPSDPSAAGARDAYKSAFEAMRAEVKTANQALTDARQALEATVKEIIKVEKNNPNASAHASTTTVI